MVKIYKKKRLRVLLRFFSVLFLGLFLIFSVIHLYLGQTLRAVEDQYIEETAILYVKNINRKIQSINQEFLMLANNLRNILPGIPQNISPRDGGYYDVLFMASDLVGSLKTRYPELKQSFLYWPASDLLAFSTGLSFASTDDFGITGQVKQRLRQQKDSLSTQVCWEILTSGEEAYILGWYRQKEIMLACLIDLNQLFAEINDMPKSYSVISFLRWNDGRVIAPQAYRKQAEPSPTAPRYTHTRLQTSAPRTFKRLRTERSFKTSTSSSACSTWKWSCFGWRSFWSCGSATGGCSTLSRNS